MLTQKEAARQLSVSRVTIWRLAKARHLNLVKLPNGGLRYRFAEVVAIASPPNAGALSPARSAA